MNLTEIDGKIGIWLVLAIVASVVAVIYVLKSIFKKTATEDLASKYKDKKWDSPMEGTYKYPDVDVFGMSGPIFRYGLAAALALSVIGLNWTSYDKKVIIPTGALAFDDEIQVEVPRTAEPPPPPPPPPPPVVQEIKVTEEKIEEKVEFVDQSIQEETVVEAPPPPAPKKEAPPPPPPPPPPKNEPDEIFKVVEETPRFPGCEDKGSMDEKKKCADEKMLQYLYKNIKYPNIAKENGVQGRCVVTFVVEKDGRITDAKVVRDIGGGCGEEALRVVNSMNEMGERWKPGKQRGNAVRVQFNLPVTFKLN